MEKNNSLSVKQFLKLFNQTEDCAIHVMAQTKIRLKRIEKSDPRYEVELDKAINSCSAILRKLGTGKGNLTTDSHDLILEAIPTCDYNTLIGFYRGKEINHLLEAKDQGEQESYVTNNTANQFKIQLIQGYPTYYGNGIVKGNTTFVVESLQDNLDYLQKLTLFDGGALKEVYTEDKTYELVEEGDGYWSVKLKNQALNQGGVKTITIDYEFLEVCKEDSYYHGFKVLNPTDLLRVKCILANPPVGLTEAELFECPDMESYRRGHPKYPIGTAKFDSISNTLELIHPEVKTGMLVIMDWSKSQAASQDNTPHFNHFNGNGKALKA